VSGNRFFIPPDVFANTEIIFPREISRQIHSVLRLKAGDMVTVLDDDGHCRQVEIREVDARQVTGLAGEICPAPGEPGVELTLCPALTQREKFEWILQKGTELGVRYFVPMITGRSLIQETGGWNEKIIRWQKIVREAAEQCGRGLVPEISTPLKFADYLNRDERPRGYILYEREQHTGLADSVMRHLSTGSRQIALLIGPEGGFTEDEAGQANSAGLVSVSLGARILRMETAAMAACVICMAVAGELGSFSATVRS